MDINPEYPLPTSLKWHPVEEAPPERLHYHYQFLVVTREDGWPSPSNAYRLFLSIYEGPLGWGLTGRMFDIVGWAYLAPTEHSSEQQLMRAREAGNESMAKEIEFFMSLKEKCLEK